MIGEVSNSQVEKLRDFLINCDADKVDMMEVCVAVSKVLKSKADPELINMLEHKFHVSISELLSLPNINYQNDLINHCPKELPILQDWLDITAETESPGSYHVASLLSWAGALIGRKTYVEMGNYRIYPTVSTILVGPSGARKSSAIRIAQRLYEFYPGDTDHLIVLKDKVTAEGLIRAITPESECPVLEPVAFIVAPELSTALGKQAYMRGIVVTLTRGMDHEGIHATTVGGGRVGVDNAGLGLLGGTTEEWIESSMTPDVVKAGFTARVLWAVENNLYRISYRPAPAFNDRIQDIAIRLSETVDDVQQSFPLSARADDFLRAWYITHRMNLNEADTGDVLESYYNRKQEHLLRLSLVLALLSGEREITEEILHGTLSLLDYYETGFADSLKRLSSPVEQRIAQHILDKVRASGKKGIPRRQLYESLGTRYPYKQIVEAFSFIMDADLVSISGGRIHAKTKSKT